MTTDDNRAKDAYRITVARQKRKQSACMYIYYKIVQKYTVKTEKCTFLKTETMNNHWISAAIDLSLFFNIT